MKKIISILFLILITDIYASETPISYNQISFSVSEEAELSNDILSITLQAFAQGQDMRDLSASVNDSMDWALKQANKVSTIEARTLNYQTNPHYEKGRQQGWQVSQSLKLSSKNVDDLSKLTGKLQKRLQLKSASYETDPKKREELLEKMTQQVLQKFAQRAAAISRALGKSGYKLVHVQVGNSHTPAPHPMMQMSVSRNKTMMDAAPVFQAGNQKIHLNASGSIELLP